MIFNKVTINKRVVGKDDYGMPLTTFTFVKTAEINIQLITANYNSQDIRFKDATHIGLTFDKEISEDYRIATETENYLVKLVNNQGRLSQLTLVKE